MKKEIFEKAKKLENDICELKNFIAYYNINKRFYLANLFDSETVTLNYDLSKSVIRNLDVFLNKRLEELEKEFDSL